MNETKKVVSINLLVMLLYNLGMCFIYANDGSERGLGIMFSLFFVVGFHVVINLILAAIYSGSKYNKLSKAFLISSGVVLLVGFSSCWVNAGI